MTTPRKVLYVRTDQATHEALAAMARETGMSMAGLTEGLLSSLLGTGSPYVPIARSALRYWRSL